MQSKLILVEKYIEYQNSIGHEFIKHEWNDFTSNNYINLIKKLSNGNFNKYHLYNVKHQRIIFICKKCNTFSCCDFVKNSKIEFQIMLWINDRYILSDMIEDKNGLSFNNVDLKLSCNEWVIKNLVE